MRQATLTILALAALSSIPATAQDSSGIATPSAQENSSQVRETWDEGGPSPDTKAATDDGYNLVDDPRSAHSAEDYALVGEKFAAEFAQEINPGVEYGYDYTRFDFDNDGLLDIVLFMKMRQPDDAKGFGVPIRILMFDGKDWTKALTDSAMAFGVRLDKDGKGEIALIDDYPNGYRPFGLDGHVFVSQGPARVPPSQPRVAPLEFAPVAPIPPNR